MFVCLTDHVDYDNKLYLLTCECEVDIVRKQAELVLSVVNMPMKRPNATFYLLAIAMFALSSNVCPI